MDDYIIVKTSLHRWVEAHIWVHGLAFLLRALTEGQPGANLCLPQEGASRGRASYKTIYTENQFAFHDKV